jgi:hypothetical protein
MLSLTKKALEEFDNQHDFERMAADILNGLGYKHVTPIAPRGGSDGGKRQVMRGHVVCGKAMAFATSPDHLHVRLPSSPANVWIYNLEADADDMWSFVVCCIGLVEERGYPANV